jgi:protoporphyrinogen IX oxidase
MAGWLGNAYLWIVSAHVIFVIFLMAALFMLPRFLVYHLEAVEGSDEAARWVDREQRLVRIILNPSLLIVWVLGIMLAVNSGLFDGAAGLGWLHAKLTLVVALSAYHGWLIGVTKKVQRGLRPLSGTAMRWLNELPGLLAIPIVILVFVKPF